MKSYYEERKREFYSENEKLECSVIEKETMNQSMFEENKQLQN